MTNIPNLGEYGYVPRPQVQSVPNYSSVYLTIGIIILIITAVVVFLFFKFKKKKQEQSNKPKMKANSKSIDNQNVRQSFIPVQASYWITSEGGRTHYGNYLRFLQSKKNV